jgi:hypothetical protein
LFSGIRLKKRGMEEMQPKLLDLIPNEKSWGLKGKGKETEISGGYGVREEKKLELRLRLGLPSEEDWNINKEKTEGLHANVKSSLSLGLFGSQTKQEGTCKNKNTDFFLIVLDELKKFEFTPPTI